jgi:hypothetical protein
MRKRKALKGGYIYSDPVMTGPLLKEQLYRVKDDDIIGINSSYTDKLKAAEKDLNRFNEIKKEANENYYKKQKNNLNEDKLQQKTNQQFIENASNFGKYSVIIIVGFLKGMFAVLKYMTSNVKFIFKMIATAGQGAIIKALFVILFIILVIVGITKGISGLNSNRTSISNTSEYGNSILKMEDDKYLAMPQSNNIFRTINEYINNLIPNEYKYNWGIITNSVSYITTGKNQYDEFLTDRDEINIGRSDNIFHINFNTYDKDKTLSIIEPKTVLLKFNENAYYNSDYNKIDNNINAVINYPKQCLLNIKPNEKGKYILDLDKTNIKYYDKNNSIIANSNLITPIFKYSKIDSNLNVGVKLNSFDTILYSGYNNANNILGAYATTLINPNYKGPILRLTNATREEINTDRENKNGKGTANFYNDYKTNELYTMINNKKVYYNEFFNIKASSVATLYDQSGNNNDLIYKMYDFVHMPEFKLDNNNNYSIYFYDQHMLLFKTKISYKKIKINTKILFSNISDASKVNYMNFLAREKEEVIKINGSDNANLVFTTTKKTDIINDDQISDKYLVSDNNKRVSELKNPYDISTKFIYNENKDDPIILECLGNAYDMRTFDEKRVDDTLNRKGENLQNKLKKHSFKGYLYELRIFKSDD